MIRWCLPLNSPVRNNREVDSAYDGSARDRAQQCIADNMLWYEITDARGNRGWVSRRFLEEAE
jgi:SH3-like domain-containing protein